jgi:hypothetical protein
MGQENLGHQDVLSGPKCINYHLRAVAISKFYLGQTLDSRRRAEEGNDRRENAKATEKETVRNGLWREGRGQD